MSSKKKTKKVVRPVGTRIMIAQPVFEDIKTPEGIIIPASVVEEEDDWFLCECLDVGDMCERGIKKGDKVFMARFTGNWHKLPDGQEVTFIEECDILGYETEIKE